MPEITTLPNGLRVISDTMRETETVSLSVWVDVGSRHELPEHNGISHFLEHMAFKGTKRRTAQQIAEEFDNIGGALNASTSREHTVYYAKVLKNDFALASDILSDIIQYSTFDETELERERGVVLQEIAMTNDTPDDIIFDHYQATAFADQGVGRSILGPEQHIQKFSRLDLEQFVSNHYAASKLVFSVAGNIDHDAVVRYAQEHFTYLHEEKKTRKDPAKYSGGQHREDRDLEQVHLVLGFNGVSYHSEDIYSIQLLSMVLGGGMSSRLFQEIREKRGLAYSVSAFTSNYADGGLFSVYAGTAPEQVEELVDVTCDELKKATDRISEDELKRAKAQARAGLLMSYEGSGFRSDEMGRHLTCFGRHVPISEILSRIEAVNVADITSMMRKVLEGSKPTVAAIGKLDQLADYDLIAKRLVA